MHHFGKGHAWSKLFFFIYFNLAFRKIIFQGFSAFYLSEHNPVLDQTANNVNWLHNIILYVLHCVFIVDQVVSPPNHC